MNRLGLYKTALDPVMQQMKDYTDPYGVGSQGAGAGALKNIETEVNIAKGKVNLLGSVVDKKKAVDSLIADGKISKDRGLGIKGVLEAKARAKAPGAEAQVVLVPVDKYGQPIRAQLNPGGRGYRTVYVYPGGTRVHSDSKKLPRTRILRAALKFQTSSDIIQNAFVNGLMTGADAGSQGIDWVYDHTSRKPGEPPLIGWGNLGRKRLFPYDYYMLLLYGGARGLLSNKGIDIPHLDNETAVSLFLPYAVINRLSKIPGGLRALVKAKRAVNNIATAGTLIAGGAGLVSAASTTPGAPASSRDFGYTFANPFTPLFLLFYRPKPGDLGYIYNKSLIQKAKDDKALPWASEAIKQLQNTIDSYAKYFELYAGKTVTDSKTGKVVEVIPKSKRFKKDYTNFALSQAVRNNIINYDLYQLLSTAPDKLDVHRQKQQQDIIQQKLIPWLNKTIDEQNNTTISEVLTDTVLAAKKAQVQKQLDDALNAGGTSDIYALMTDTSMSNPLSKGSKWGTITGLIRDISLPGLAVSKMPSTGFWNSSAFTIPTAAASQAAIGGIQTAQRNQIMRSHKIPEFESEMKKAEKDYAKARNNFFKYRANIRYSLRDERYKELMEAYKNALIHLAISRRNYSVAYAQAISLLSVKAKGLHSAGNLALYTTLPWFRYMKNRSPLIATSIYGQQFMNLPLHLNYINPNKMHEGSYMFGTTNTGHNAKANLMNRPKSLMEHIMLGLSGGGPFITDFGSSLYFDAKRAAQYKAAEVLGDVRDQYGAEWGAKLYDAIASQH